MMTKVLGVVGSPRKRGNTHILVSKILDGASYEGATVEAIFLDDLKIRECDGCHACWNEKECSKKDDMNDIYPKIIESDVILFGTPVYWYGPTGLMKLFIDRFVYFNCPENRAKIRGKAAAIAVPFEEEDLDTVAPLELFFEKCLSYLEMEFVGKIIAPGVGWKGEVLEKEEYLKDAYKLGIRLANRDTT